MKHRSVVSNFIFRDIPSTSSDATPNTLPSDNNPVLLREQGGLEVALFRRSYHPDVHTYQGKLAPISGSIDASDANATAAAARELWEETKLFAGRDLKLDFVGKPFYIEDRDAQRSWTVHPFGWTLLASADKIKLDWEHEGWQWTDPSDVLSGKLQHECVPQLERSLQRVYLGYGGMFTGITKGTNADREFLDGLELLRNDHEHGARVLATRAVTCLASIIATFPLNHWNHWWTDLRMAAYHLIYSARSSMNAAISSAVLSALHDLLPKLSDRTLDPKIVLESLQSSAAQRDKMSKQISKSFASYLTSLVDRNHTNQHFSVLTLSSSSTICTAIVDFFQQFPDCHLDLFILESRPKCEGASLAATLLKSIPRNLGSNSRLTVTVAPDSHIAHFTHQAIKTGNPAILLLGADRISPSGHVSNKMGSCAAAIIVKTLAPDMKVVVLSETDKIAKPTNLSAYQNQEEDPQQEMKEHSLENNDPEEVSRIWQQAGAGENVDVELKEADAEVQNIYFEWVPSQYIDVYVSEEGVLQKEQIRAKSMEKARFEEEIFGDLYDER